MMLLPPCFTIRMSWWCWLTVLEFLFFPMIQKKDLSDFSGFNFDFQRVLATAAQLKFLDTNKKPTTNINTSKIETVRKTWESKNRLIINKDSKMLKMAKTLQKSSFAGKKKGQLFYHLLLSWTHLCPSMRTTHDQGLSHSLRTPFTLN